MKAQIIDNEQMVLYLLLPFDGDELVLLRQPRMERLNQVLHRNRFD